MHLYFLDERGVPMLDLPFWLAPPPRLAWAEVAELEQLLGELLGRATWSIYP